MVWHRTLICFVWGGGYPPLWAPSPFRRGRPGVVPLLFLIQRLILWTSRWCDGGDSQRRRGGTRRKHESYGRTPGCRFSCSVFVDFSSSAKFLALVHYSRIRRFLNRFYNWFRDPFAGSQSRSGCYLAWSPGAGCYLGLLCHWAGWLLPAPQRCSQTA